MAIPQTPPLNGRNLAEFYVAGEAAKRTTLRGYARPPEQQQARIIMYDPIRRNIPDYFKSGRDPSLLSGIEQFLIGKHFPNKDFDETWHKSNRTALANLQALKIPGEFRDVRKKATDLTVGGIRVVATTDFFATYVPKASNGKAKNIAVIINPSGIKRPAVKRKVWIAIESEVSARAAKNCDVAIDEVWYIDLPKNEVSRHVGQKKTVSAEIEATCERILRDWRSIRLEESQVTGTGSG